MNKFDNDLFKTLKDFLIKPATLLICAIFFIAMGEGSKTSRINEPRFVELQKGNPSLRAEVVDGNSKIQVYDISFGGTTKIGGLRRESVSSIDELDLNDIIELKILDSSFRSMRYPGEEFILAKSTFKNGSVKDDLLIPKNIQFSAKDLGTEGSIKPAWDLSKINAIIIKHEEQLEPLKDGRRREIPKEA